MMVKPSSKNQQSTQKAEPTPSKPQSTYILEVGYELVYKRTYDEQMNILREYLPQKKFHNSWKKSVLSFGQQITEKSITYGFFMKAVFSTLPFFDRLAVVFGGSLPLPLLLTYSIGGMFQDVITNQIFSIAIPILPANKYSEGMLFIPGHMTKFLPHEKNVSQDKKSNVEINIKPDEFDPIVHDIARAYGGEIITTGPKNKDRKSKIQTILYKFVNTKEQSIETQIKRFLYSLPINVILISIYKLDSKNLLGNSGINDKALLFPRKDITRKSLIDDSHLSRLDKKIIEYGETQVAIYNKVNKNIKYLVEYIRPLWFIQRLLPKSYRIPEFSPMK